MADILSYYKSIGKEDVIFAYKGEINTQLLRSIIQAADTKMDSLGEGLGFRKRVSGVLIEALQNIMRHGEKVIIDGKEVFPVIVIANQQHEYVIATGNVISTPEVEKLRTHIEKVNAMSPEEQRNLYNDQLKAGTISEKGGAGLGIIDIARKSKNNKVEFDFIQVNEEYYFFSMFVVIEQPKRKA